MTGAEVAPPTLVAYGDAGLLVTCTQPDPDSRWRAAQALQAALLEDRAGGVVDVVAGFETAFVSFDPARTTHDAVAALVRSCADQARPARPGRRFRVPVVYGGERGPDLAVVADQLGLEPAAVVDLHTASPWTVRLRGSPAGSPMTDGPALPATVSRNPTPRTRVPAGSVALSGAQCMVYNVDSPGGWRLIGRTPVRMLDLTLPALVAYAPGDELVFVPVPEREWDRWAGRSLQPEP